MKLKNDTYIKILKCLKYYCLIYGIILLFFSCFGLFAIFFQYTNNFFPTFYIFVSLSILIITLLISGSLLVLTYHGLSNSKIYTKITGLSGGSILILGSILSLLIVKARLTIDILIIVIIPSIVIILLFAVFWKKIPAFNEIQVTKKTKKIVAIIVIISLVTSALIIVIPNIQKHLALNSLDYVDYENGWGFNPPENWQIDNAYDGVFLWPIDENMSDKNPLGIFYGTTSSNIDEIGQKQLENFENDFWINKTENFSFVSYGKKTTNGMDSYEVVYSFKPIYENGTVGPEMKIKTIVIVKGNKAIYATYQCLLIYYGKYEYGINQSLSSLVIV